MGGAGFPTDVKLHPANLKQLNTLIINGIECEPYITSDDRLMREHAWQIRQGIDILQHLVSPRHVIIAIEDNKPEAIEKINPFMHVFVQSLPAFYDCTKITCGIYTAFKIVRHRFVF